MDKLRGRVGHLVKAVGVDVEFFGSEKEGEIGDVLITFADGAAFWLGCAGDGSVLVTRAGAVMGDAPEMTTIHRALSGLRGELKNVACEDNWVRLEIGDRVLHLINACDQMELVVDGATLPRNMYERD